MLTVIVATKEKTEDDFDSENLKKWQNQHADMDCVAQSLLGFCETNKKNEDVSKSILKLYETPNLNLDKKKMCWHHY
jgi:hypothetical protein